MMHGGSKTIGYRNISAHKSELDEYFAELEDESLDGKVISPQSQASDDRSVQEQLRRLAAYVAHLRQKVADLSDSPNLTAPRSNYRAVSAGLATIVVAGVGTIFAARLWARR